MTKIDEVLDTDSDFTAFHDVEIAEYKVPLILNGDDDLPNLELSDMDVYWGIMGQLIAQ